MGLNFCPCGQRFSWNFLQADVTCPILGADFLAAHQLCVDIAQRRVTSSQPATPPLTAELHSIQAGAVNFLDILKEFPDVAGKVPFSGPPRVHDLHHHIMTEGPKVPKPGPNQIGSCQGGVLQDGTRRDYPPFQLSMGESFTYGTQKGSSTRRSPSTVHSTEN